MNGDSVADLTAPPTMSTLPATASSHVGSYAIDATGAASTNYTISYVPGTLTVTPASLTITANNATKVYGAGLPPLTASYSGWGNSDSPASLTTPTSLSTTTTASSHVLAGGYPITASGASDTDYTISYQPGTLTVTAAPLTVTANNAEKVYPQPVLSASYSGLVNGDTPASLAFTPVLSTTVTSASQVGPYAISVSGAEFQ